MLGAELSSRDLGLIYGSARLIWQAAWFDGWLSRPERPGCVVAKAVASPPDPKMLDAPAGVIAHYLDARNCGIVNLPLVGRSFVQS